MASFAQLLFDTQFVVGATSYLDSYPGHKDPRIVLTVSLGGRQTIQAVVDTAAPWCVIDPELVDLIRDLVVHEDDTIDPVAIRGREYPGKLIRVRIGVQVDSGTSPEIEATLFVPALLPNETWMRCVTFYPVPSSLLNPTPEDMASSDLASVGDVEFATPVYVAQHLAVIGMLVGSEAQHVELVFGCPFSCWSDEALKTELREALRGLHRFTLNGVSRSIYLTPYLLPQPIMAAANLIVPGGVPNPALADTLVGIIDIGTGTDDYALVRGFRTESGRAGGDSGTRGLAWACEELWTRLKQDDRFPLLRREPFPGAHGLLPVLDTNRFRYGGELVHVAPRLRVSCVT